MSETPPEDVVEEQEAEASPAEEAKDLGDAGQKALQAERENARKLRRELQQWKQLEKQYGLSPGKVEDLAKGVKRDAAGNVVDVEQVRREARLEAEQLFGRQLVRDKVALLAANEFADPEDVLVLLGSQLDEFDVENGRLTHPEDVKAALAELLKKKPYLAKKQDKQPPDFEGGGRARVAPATDMMSIIRKERARKGS